MCECVAMVARSELSAAELRVWEAFPRGRTVRLGGEEPDPDEVSQVTAGGRRGRSAQR